MFVDQKMLPQKLIVPSNPVFSRDSKHVAWFGSPKIMEDALYIDGNPAATFDRLSSEWPPPRFNADGSIDFLAQKMMEDGVFRVHVAP